MQRRDLLAGLGRGAAALALSALFTRDAGSGDERAAALSSQDDPFTLGVASGMPRQDSVVLWTRLAPRPHEPLGGLPEAPIRVQWELAEDERFSIGLRRGDVLARPEHAHSVHAEVTGLPSGREFFYRFLAGDAASPIGRTRTAPSADAPVDRLRIALASCQHYEQGAFRLQREIAERDLDFVLFVGDYLYESSNARYRGRAHEGPAPTTLDGYRQRHATYKLDPSLRAAHAAHPWVLTWDDHEVENDYANDASRRPGVDARAFLQQRAAAYKAYFEHMPVSPAMRPDGAAMHLHEHFSWGQLADLWTLDNRQYRSVQACQSAPTPWRCDTDRGRKILFSGAGGGSFMNPEEPACRAELADPARTMLGAEQEQWLDAAFAESRATWNLLTQGIMFVTIRESWNDSPRIFTDAWAGYPPARERLLASLARHKTANPVVLTGDIHSFWVNEIANAAGRAAGVELVTSSIATTTSDKTALLPLNPQVRFHEGRHSGYIRCDLDRGKLRADIVAIDDRLDPRSGRSVLASFEVRAADPHAHRI